MKDIVRTEQAAAPMEMRLEAAAIVAQAEVVMH